VHVQAVDQSLADSFGLDSPAGALVSSVEPDSAASEAGLKAGDVILKYNGEPVKDSAALSMRVNTTTPGEKAKLDVWRNGKRIELTAKIRSADEGRVAFNGGNSGGGETHAALGLELRPLTREEREQAGVTGGLVVEGVEGKAAQAGIQEGDVLLGVDGTPVESVAQLRKLVQDKDSKRAALLIQRGDARIFVPIALG
jgi:serine protease Do